MRNVQDRAIVSLRESTGPLTGSLAGRLSSGTTGTLREPAAAILPTEHRYGVWEVCEVVYRPTRVMNRIFLEDRIRYKFVAVTVGSEVQRHIAESSEFELAFGADFATDATPPYSDMKAIRPFRELTGLLAQQGWEEIDRDRGRWFNRRFRRRVSQSAGEPALAPTLS